MSKSLKSILLILTYFLSSFLCALADDYSIPEIQFPSVEAQSEMPEHVDPHIIEQAVKGGSLPEDAGEGQTDADAQMDAILKDLANNYWKGEIQKQIQRARVAIKLRDFDQAEEAYVNALNRQMSEDERKLILFEMVQVYDRLGIDSKKASILEKYLELYPKDPKVAEILFDLGKLYREMGAYETAIARFYGILNMSLGAKIESLDSLKQQSLKAQLEIAETYFLMKDYKQARIFFERLRRLDIPKANKINVDFKFSYTLFQEERYIEAIAEFDMFLMRYPSSRLVPEVRFLKAMTLRRLGKPEEAVSEVKQLIDHHEVEDDRSAAIWLYWQKRTANQIANEFYNQKDYLSALRVYQAMLPLSSDARWQWPIIYQMGLCFEHLSMHPMALQSYDVILKADEWDLPKNLDQYLNNIKEMAAWRKEHLEWFVRSDANLKDLLSPKAPLPKPSA